MGNAHDRLRPARIQGWISIVGNTLLFGFKLWAGFAVGSTAIIADAWHTLSDSLSSAVLVIGAKIAGRPADKKHPYGYGRAELVAALIIGIMLFVVAFEFAVSGVERLRNPEITEYGKIGLIAMVVSIVIKEAMAQYAFWGARRNDLASLKADGWHHRSDAISSVILLLGMLFAGSWPYLDGVLTLAVALIIAYAAYEVIRNVWDQILGKEISAELEQKVTAIAQNIMEPDIHAHHFHLHEYGMHTELSFHIRMPGDLPLETAHECAQKIERAIQNELGIAATIHVEPLH